MKEKNSKSIIYKILFTVFSVVFIGASSILISDWYRETQAQKKFEELSGLIEETESESETEIETQIETETEPESEVDVLAERGIVIPEKNLDWNALYEENEHIVAWIYIPGTKVDYPILRHPKDDNYYLNRNLDGSVGYPGCIYMQTVNTGTFMDLNTLLYGHNMKNGTMFAPLHKYEDMAFLEENHYLYIYMPEKTLVYDIFAAYVASADHVYYMYDFTVKEGLQEYIDDIFSIRDMSANIRRDVEVTSETPLITMVTCIAGRKQNRYIVNAALINTAELNAYEQAETQVQE